MAKQDSTTERALATNRQAGFNYFLEDRLETGLVLKGSEIKSLREGRAGLKEAYVRIDAGEAWLLNAHIPPYDPAARDNHDPLRPRKLLMHKKELRAFGDQAKLKGFTIVPLRIYLKKGRAKLEIALGRGKKNFDKRETIKKRDVEREIAREIGRR
jgi:SsrA-binding protein